MKYRDIALKVHVLIWTSVIVPMLFMVIMLYEITLRPHMITEATPAQASEALTPQEDVVSHERYSFEINMCEEAGREAALDERRRCSRFMSHYDQIIEAGEKASLAYQKSQVSLNACKAQVRELMK